MRSCGKGCPIGGSVDEGREHRLHLDARHLQLVGHHLSERTTAASLPRTLLPRSIQQRRRDVHDRASPRHLHPSPGGLAGPPDRPQVAIEREPIIIAAVSSKEPSRKPPMAFTRYWGDISI
jgi:hypothetical protein